jgi:hypothetical protein
LTLQGKKKKHISTIKLGQKFLEIFWNPKPRSGIQTGANFSVEKFRLHAQARILSSQTEMCFLAEIRWKHLLEGNWGKFSGKNLTLQGNTFQTEAEFFGNFSQSEAKIKASKLGQVLIKQRW